MDKRDEKFTRHDAKADTSDIPDLAIDDDLFDSFDDMTAERSRRAVSYRERQRMEAEREELRRRTLESEQYLGRFEERPRRTQPSRSASGYTGNARTQPPRPAGHTGNARTPQGGAKKKKKRKKMSIAYRVICGILGTLIGLIVIVAAVGAVYLYRIDIKNPLTNQTTPNGGDTAQYTQYYEDENGEETRVLDTIYEGTETDSFRTAVREWKSLGNAYLQSNKVINVLLVGLDRNYDGSDGRSDTMLLASVNLKTKRIVLSSFYRDSWMYETFDNGERSAWAKLNATYVYGGAEGLISNLEDYYKIKIDHIVSVDFQSFQSIVDAVGGVTVPVQDYEAEFINEHVYRQSVFPGENVTLKGDEALWYVRMRHTDSDGEVSRTRRQRQFISALISEFRNMSPGQINDVVNTLFQYVETDMSMSDIIKYGTRALFGKWYDFELVQQQVPSDDYRYDYYDEDDGGVWVWLVDYPGAAYAMQMEIYGYSNIVLNESRYTMIDIARDLVANGYYIIAS